MSDHDTVHMAWRLAKNQFLSPGEYLRPMCNPNLQRNTTFDATKVTCEACKGKVAEITFNLLQT